MSQYNEICKVLKEFGNVSVGIGGVYETPARPFKKATKKNDKSDIKTKLKGLVKQKGTKV